MTKRLLKQPFFINSMKQSINIVFFAILLTGCSTSKQVAQRKSEKEAKELIEFANQYIGTRYLPGGTTPKGFDCSGYVQFTYEKIGYSLPRTTKEQAKIGAKIKKKNLKTGDLVFFRGRNKKPKSIRHVGIVTETDKKGKFNFIHASSAGVKIDNSELSYYKIRYIKAQRIIGSQ